jgi:enoyl-[acyl-carrier protein] reductase III
LGYFQDKIVLVTGGGRGIGRAIVLHFGRLGAHLVLNYFRHRAPAEDTAAEIRSLGRQALVVKANLAEIDNIQKLAESVEAEFGGLDILVHNAASGYNRPVLGQRVKGWDWTMNINARSLLFLAQSLTPLMEGNGGGCIVAISSPGANQVLPDYVVVGASKAAIESLVRYLAVELAGKNINVNAISPGMALTDALQYFEAIKNDSTVIERTRKLTPAARLVTPEDIAGVVEFLCSPQAHMIRGQVIAVDGGIGAFIEIVLSIDARSLHAFR